MTAHGRPRVLLADDDVGILTSFERLLTLACDVVGRVTTVEALVDAAALLQPDVIVADVFMRPGDGLLACRQIRDAFPGTRIVMITAADDPAIREEARRIGVSAVVSKMQAADELVAAVLGDARVV